MASQPNEKFIFLRDLLPPNPRPRMRIDVGSVMGDQPLITTFGGVNTIFIMRPNKGVFYIIMEPEIDVVYELSHSLRERSVQHKGPLMIGYDIFDRKVKVVDVDDGSQRS